MTPAPCERWFGCQILPRLALRRDDVRLRLPKTREPGKSMRNQLSYPRRPSWPPRMLSPGGKQRRSRQRQKLHLHNSRPPEKVNTSAVTKPAVPAWRMS